eukprot:2442903-Prymnesium_polylepis.2
MVREWCWHTEWKVSGKAVRLAHTDVCEVRAFDEAAPAVLPPQCAILKLAPPSRLPEVTNPFKIRSGPRSLTPTPEWFRQSA